MTADPAAVALLRTALAVRGRARVTVSGDSMLPALATGGRVTLVAAPFDEVEVGDVIAFEQAGRVLVHRAVDRAEREIRTAGDNHWFVDPVVTPASFLGKVPLPAGPGARTWRVPGPRAADRPDGQPIRVQPWIFSAVPRPGFPCPCHEVRVIPVAGVGSDPGALRLLRDELAGFDLVVACNPLAVRDFSSLTEIEWPRFATVALLIGGMIGEGAAGTHDFIPSALTDVQVRPSGFGEAVAADGVVPLFLSFLSGVVDPCLKP
ncbi:S26 family signal peptidase [Kitasatospora viridis]|uniref:Peptidase S24-like protein n=1 Tax=Kitasatospora viridis TaxID=281105 RepID=A0A561UPZ3_9ACTN|nr:S26 family signal peptidase [Kitasatospora viridis]TWG01432.1 peptidase S24-like protein [Kitasatospora viridis]